MVINAISVRLAVKPFVSHSIAFIIVAMSVLSKFAKCCKRIAKAAAYGVSVGPGDLPTIRLWALCALPVKKHNWCITERFNPSRPRKFVLTRCGHSSQKTKAMHPGGIESGGLLDWVESGSPQWLDSRRLRGQTHRCVHWAISREHRRKDRLQAIQHRWLGGYERVLPPEIEHHIGKDKTQRLERTNGTVRQQTGRWHRRQNKFGKVWEQTKVTTRLVVSYFNWIWQHSRFKTTAAQRARLTTRSWTWHDIATYPTLI